MRPEASDSRVGRLWALAIAAGRFAQRPGPFADLGWGLLRGSVELGEADLAHGGPLELDVDDRARAIASAEKILEWRRLLRAIGDGDTELEALSDRLECLARSWLQQLSA